MLFLTHPCGTCTHFREWLLIGSKKPLQINVDKLASRMSEPILAVDMRMIHGGIKSPADLLSLYMKGRDFLVDFAADAEPVIDDKTKVDYTTP